MLLFLKVQLITNGTVDNEWKTLIKKGKWDELLCEVPSMAVQDSGGRGRHFLVKSLELLQAFVEL